ncbi:uvrD-like Helicase, ATP-binding domain, P-loop containing nucleoside triphosphate hydrolase [Artemisia annua]|uniref:UvrD-like Helicase, ATP-binding domain, P-loop containing nucleoside triphosphate hydrolase n=1 Tax=Artemisia annua TaxID=35608 RepID=A0A2U1M1V4_ARTAN|nr:uvrD-like Helicase, ATP-binding domain, P-loop containing nucleoside triphosphate hydrolase [Artemisia annua]
MDKFASQDLLQVEAVKTNEKDVGYKEHLVLPEFIPLDWRKSMCEDLIYLRMTDLCVNVLDEIILRNVDIISDLDYWEIGRVMMVCLGSRTSVALYEQLINKLESKPMWKLFVGKLRDVGYKEHLVLPEFIPLDWRKSMCEDLIYLRMTDLCVNVLDEIILRNVDIISDLDYWEIGRVMMVCLGSRTSVALYEQLINKLESKPMWKLFVGKLRDVGYKEHLVLPEFIPLDWRKSMCEDLIYLRMTDLCVNVLDEIILRNVDIISDLDYWEIGRVMMVCLGSRTSVALYEQLINKLESKPMWKLFVGKLRDVGYKEHLVLPEFIPLDWRKSMCEDLIYLRMTDLCVNVLDEIILRNVDIISDLDYWEIGRVMMVCLGSRTSVALYEQLINKLESKPMWKLFVGKLRDVGYKEHLVLPEFIPLDWRKSMCEDLIYLRMTDLCVNVLDEIILRNVDIISDLDYWEIGRVMMVCLGSRTSVALYEQLINKLESKPMWKLFVGKLRDVGYKEHLVLPEFIPLDWRKSMCEDLIYLRMTDLCVNVLDEIILRNVDIISDLDYWEIGRVMMVCLGSRTSVALYEQLINKLESKPMWKLFVGKLRDVGYKEHLVLPEFMLALNDILK